MWRTILRSCLCLSVLASPAFADDEGGKAPEQLGKVSFANSCSTDVQATFERAVALLHSFWWSEGDKAFRAVLAQDPSCAIATWGIAAIAINNPFATGPTPEAAKAAQDALAQGRAIGAKTERERGYIEAMSAYYDHFSERPHRVRIKSLADAFGALAARYPDDDETQIFSAIYLTATQDPKEKTYATALRAAHILEIQFAKHPDHPGVAHYLIHSYDYPAIAAEGLTAALCYADIAASAPHALHMPTHIFTRVGAWKESVAMNLRSSDLAAQRGETPDQLHAMDYMVYADLQLGRDGDAAALVERAHALAGTHGPQSVSYALAAIPARYVVERGQWQEAKALSPVESPQVFTTAMTYFGRAIGAARSGDAARAEQDTQQLARIAEDLKAKDPYWATEVEVQHLGAAAWTAYAQGRGDDALKLMREAAELEDSSDKSAVTPGRLLPARELLGDMLMESHDPAGALKEYEASLLRDPKRFRSLHGAADAAAASGDAAKARGYFTQLTEIADAGSARPELAEARNYLASK